jgi:predicted ArsR family transcriptional regulator
MIKIDFEFETPYGKFADALHLPVDHTFSDDDIQAMKQQRVDNWIAVVTAPPPDAPPEE